VKLLSEYYTSQAKRRSRPSDDPLTFLDYCATQMAEEASRARAVLPDTSWNAVQAMTEISLLLGHLDWLAYGG
jgi:cullin 4